MPWIFLNLLILSSCFSQYIVFIPFSDRIAHFWPFSLPLGIFLAPLMEFCTPQVVYIGAPWVYLLWHVLHGWWYRCWLNVCLLLTLSFCNHPFSFLSPHLWRSPLKWPPLISTGRMVTCREMVIREGICSEVEFHSKYNIQTYILQTATSHLMTKFCSYN